MHRLILHVISKSHPLWQVHAQSHLTRHIKIPPPLASTCTVSSYTSYQNPTPSGKYMHSHILHYTIKIPPPLASTYKVTSYITRSKSHPLWQAHTKSHLTVRIKIPPPLASTCTVSSYTSNQNPTPSGKYMHSLILHVISKSHPLWQVHARSHLTRHIKIPPPLASTCTVSSYTSYQNPTPLASTCKVTSYTSYQNPTPSGKYMHSLILHVYGSWFIKHSLRAMFYESWFTNHGLRAMVYESWFTKHGLRAVVYESWFTKHSLRAMVYESWFTKHSLRAMVYRSRSQPAGTGPTKRCFVPMSHRDPSGSIGYIIYHPVYYHNSAHCFFGASNPHGHFARG